MQIKLASVTVADQKKALRFLRRRTRFRKEGRYTDQKALFEAGDSGGRVYRERYPGGIRNWVCISVEKR